MTFPTSYYNMKLMRANFKRNRHVMIVETIALFLASSLIIIMQHAQANGKANFLAYDYVLSFQGLNIFSIFLMCVFPIVIACFGQSYLYQKRSIAFYHSQPFTRTQLYVSNYLSGFFSYVVPLFLIFLCNTVLYFVLGFGSSISYISLVQGFLISILFYTLLYSVAVFAATLSGNIVAQIFMIIFVFSIISAIECMLQFCIASWYDKIPFQEFRTLLNSFPMLYLAKAISSYRSFYMGDILYCVFYTLAFAVAGCYCYRARKSEDCNKFYVFVWVKRVVKYAVTFLAAVLLGVVFQQIVYNHHILFMVLGFVIGGFLSFTIIQSIYEKSFRSMFANMKAFIPFCIITCALMLFLSADVFKMNDYIPQRSHIQSIGLSVSNEYDNHEVIFEDEKNIGSLYAIAEEGRETTKEDAYQEVIFDYHTSSVLGHMKRICYLSKETFDKMVESIYDSKEYKTQYANITALNNIKKLISVSIDKAEYTTVYDAKESNAIEKERTIQLLNIVKKDVANHSYSDIKNSYPYATIHITTHGRGLNQNDQSFIIYGCYSDTMAYLKSHYQLTNSTEIPESVEMTITTIENGKEIDDESSFETKEITIDNKQFIEELTEKAFNGNYSVTEPFTVNKQKYHSVLSIKTSSDTYFNVSYYVLSAALQQEINRYLIGK